MNIYRRIKEQGKVTERARDTYKYWLNQNLEDIELTKELEAISQDAKAIEERFYKDLEFGTGGLKGDNGSWDQPYECLYSCQSHPGILQLFEKKLFWGNSCLHSI